MRLFDVYIVTLGVCFTSVVCYGFSSDSTGALSPKTRLPADNSPFPIAVSQKKCKEYARLALNGFEPKCEITDNTAKSGNASFGELPHMAQIVYKTNTTENFVCGGTLISENFVMTAAYCFAPGLKGEVFVVLGELVLHIETDGTRSQLIKAAEIIVHPGSKAHKYSTSIALVRLAEPAKLDAFVRPACFHNGESSQSKSFIASGWGVDINSNGERIDYLQKFEMLETSHQKCKDSYEVVRDSDGKEIFAVDESSMICTLDPLAKVDICQGYGGGPLSITSTDEFCSHEIVGVIGFGEPCFRKGKPSKPMVSARVSFYVKWIESVVWP